MASSIDKKTLLIRNLPPIFSPTQVQEFCTLYGAQSVKYFGSKGRMKHSAFATFSSAAACRTALAQLHQQSVLNYILRVEYANVKQRESAAAEAPCLFNQTSTSVQGSQSVKVADAELRSKLDYLSKSWDIQYNFSDQTFYRYPLATEETLQNILHCMASVPKFYVQVLHLMNKMNLPPPFGELTTQPPLCKSRLSPLSADFSSSESELESSEENDGKSKFKGTKRLPGKSHKRANPAQHTELYAKRLKSQLDIPVQVPPSLNADKPKAVAIQDVFEVVREQAKQAQITLATQSIALPTDQPHSSTSEPSDSFGKIEKPVQQIGYVQQTGHVQQAELMESQVISSDQSQGPTTTPYITARELREGALPEEEMDSHPLLKKYSPGEPTHRLYVKNLAKQTTSDQLKYIFGRYVDWNNESEAETFDIRHMTEGRMKGQAFVTLPNIDAAQAALKECHLYRLNSRPMIVAFGKAHT